MRQCYKKLTHFQLEFHFNEKAYQVVKHVVFRTRHERLNQYVTFGFFSRDQNCYNIIAIANITVV